MKKLKLTGQEHKTVTALSRVIYANPFSDERAEADRAFAGISPDIEYEERMQRVIDEAVEVTARLVAAGKGDIRGFSGDNRILMENTFLFDVYHRFAHPFDELITRQVEQKTDTPSAVPFAQEAIGMLEGFGFSHDEAVHYFSVFFQMRRAYYFIRRGIVGRSRAMKELRLALWNNVFTHDIMLYSRHIWSRMEDYSTMLLGGTGTGKGISSAAIGRSGYIPFDERTGRFAESFTRAYVSLNLSQFPEQLIESELFGHEKGAFTGAVADHEGVLSQCSPHGAIFLDEIGEVSVPVQIKLLQVLQERVYSPVGSHQRFRFPGRVIAATNRPIEQLRGEGGFREDFYYRLCSDIITVPPLRERIRQEPGELDDLIDHTLTRIVGKQAPEIARGVKADIRAHVPPEYHWPGNVRELEQCIRSVLLKRSYDAAPEPAPKGQTEAFLSGVTTGQLSHAELLSGYCKLLYGMHGTYEAVSRRTGLDRRTVKKYVEA